MMTCLDDSGFPQADTFYKLVRARDEIVRLRDALRAIEFSFPNELCPHCHGYDGAKENPRLHIPECPIARVLRSDKMVQMVYDPKDEIRTAYRKSDDEARSRLRD